MAHLNRDIIEGTPAQGDSVVEFGSGTESVWRLGTVKSVQEDKALVQFDVQSDGTSWLGYPSLLVSLDRLKKIA